ncbi:hypothetical protein RFF05_06910 [Bengtsoniella intestinalis]|uniref:hypothetical protein n=1 Tax=Bengtsoniella intestinalis TaxID=3073143 RepID=UPI00391F4A7A
MSAESLIATVLPSLIVALFMAAFTRRQAARDKATDERAEARKKESLLALEMQMATAKMSYATAVALKRGYANGEVEEGVAAYDEARKKYFHFLNEQATDHLAS